MAEQRDVQALAETVRLCLETNATYATRKETGLIADSLAALDGLVALLNKQEEALKRLTTMEAFTGVAVDLRFTDTATLRRELQARQAFACAALEGER